MQGPTMTTRIRWPNRAGFTLIEMAVVIVIIGIIISIVASVLPSLIGSSKIRQGQAVMEKVDLALQGFLAANGRLPCPDTDGNGLENRIEGASPPTDDTCAAYVGRLPYATLGLYSALDPWQEPIRYGVYEDMVRTRTDTLCASAPCTLCLRNFISNPDPDFVRTSDGVNTTNQAYVIASGGPKNLSGAGGFFDGRNAAADGEFETPHRTMDAQYDDLVRAASFTYLMGKLCRGSLGGGNDPDPWADCVDEFGVPDCTHPDCFDHPACVDPETLQIVTQTIPSGPLAGAYMTTIGAGGGTTPYTWDLTNGAGFSDFTLNAYTGTLEGTLDQCPGTYNVGVRVQDATDPGAGGPQADSRTFALEVTPALSVTCTSTPGASITWSSPTQQETFRADGGRLGTINWSLSTGGAAGFGVYATGDNTCVLRKTGSTAPGVYMFTLTATDGTCPTNTASLQFDVTVTAEGGGVPGGISGVVSALTFSLYQTFTPDIIYISGNDYAIAARGYNNRGYLHTVDITPEGQIGTRDYYYAFDTGDTHTPDIIRVSGDVFAIAYRVGNQLRVQTVRIANGGQSMSTLQTRNLGNQRFLPVTAQVGSDMFAVFSDHQGGEGRLTTLQISADGQTIADQNEVSVTNRNAVDLVHVTGDIYALVHRTGSGSQVSTITINDAGQIGGTLLDTLVVETGNGADPQIVKAGGDLFAIAYQGPNDRGVVKTVQIAPDGEIGNATVDTLVFDTQSAAMPAMVNAGGGIFAVAYTGPGNQGVFATILIDPDGRIGDTVMDRIVFESDTCLEPSMIAMGNNLFAVVYRGPNSNRGVVATIALE